LVAVSTISKRLSILLRQSSTVIRAIFLFPKFLLNPIPEKSESPG
jgi:hypothetical protein